MFRFYLRILDLNHCGDAARATAITECVSRLAQCFLVKALYLFTLSNCREQEVGNESRTAHVGGAT